MQFSIEMIRHSAAHVMAAAVKELYPEAKFDIGPSTEDGFYYDFDIPQHLAVEDLVKIEEKMEEIKKAAYPFTCQEVSREEAQKMLAGQQYKLERLADIPDDGVITMYSCGNFTDLCRGPHVATTADIGAVKLMSVAGSYYRGKESNPMLQRIYGTAFPTKKELDAYLTQLEEAKKRKKMLDR